MIKKRLDELKLTGLLPSPTGVGLTILQLTRGEDFAMGEITHTIQADPALSGRILVFCFRYYLSHAWNKRSPAECNQLGKVMMEKSPGYYYSPQVPLRMCQTLGAQQDSDWCMAARAVGEGLLLLLCCCGG